MKQTNDWRRRLAGMLLAACTLPRCDRPLPDSAAFSAAQQEVRPSRFEAATAATVRGTVRWRGQFPVTAPFEIYPNPLAGEVLSRKQTCANPNLPVVNRANRGVRDAVVFLRGVNRELARPWDLPPVHVEQQSCQLHIVQGDSDSPVGFVHLGDEIEMVSRDRFFHSLHADGAAFFTYTFPDPDDPLRRSFDRPGVVELTSAAGYFWMRAYLFVVEHSYYARTDADGHFELPGVPPGRYEVVCWLPNWLKARHERDPESAFITRWFFRPPVEMGKSITVSTKECREVDFDASLEHFDRDPKPR
jgi:hypothetical protein